MKLIEKQIYNRILANQMVIMEVLAQVDEIQRFTETNFIEAKKRTEKIILAIRSEGTARNSI